MKPSTRTVLLSVLALAFLLLAAVNLIKGFFLPGLAYVGCALVLGLLAKRNAREDSGRG